MYLEVPFQDHHTKMHATVLFGCPYGFGSYILFANLLVLLSFGPYTAIKKLFIQRKEGEGRGEKGREGEGEVLCLGSPLENTQGYVKGNESVK
jgi:hypothetical protein